MDEALRELNVEDERKAARRSETSTTDNSRGEQAVDKGLPTGYRQLLSRSVRGCRFGVSVRLFLRAMKHNTTLPGVSRGLWTLVNIQEVVV